MRVFNSRGIIGDEHHGLNWIEPQNDLVLKLVKFITGNKVGRDLCAVMSQGNLLKLIVFGG